MARRYSASLADTAANSTTLGGIVGATTVRPRVYDVIVGSPATPADQAAHLTLGRTTTASSGGSSVTPQPLDPADPAAVTAAAQAPTGEPTYTSGAVLLNIPLNQQATFRWVQLPENGLVVPATANNGLHMLFVSTTGSASHHAQIFFEE